MTEPISAMTVADIERELAEIPVAPDVAARWGRPQVQRVGLGYLARYEQLGVEAHLDRLRESRGELSAELTITRYGTHLLRQRFNLSSGPARVSAARYLDSVPRPKDWTRVDWREVLEMACLEVLDQHRAGEPFNLVGHRPIADRATRRLIDPYLPIGRPSSIFAPWGAGKSTVGAAVVVTLELAVQVIPGWPAPAERVRCLILDWESDPDEWNDRLARIAAGVGAEFLIERVPLHRQCRAPLDEQVEKVAEVIARNQIGFVLIDSAEKAIGASAGAESYGDRAGRLFAAIDQLGVTSLILDHVSGDDMKRADGRPIRKAIGSTMKGAWARAVYELKREREPDTLEQRVELVLHTAKVNDGPPLRPFEFAIVYDDDAIRFERARVTAPELALGLSKPERMARILARGAMAEKAIAEELDTSASHVRSILAKHPERFVRLPDASIGLAMPR